MQLTSSDFFLGCKNDQHLYNEEKYIVQIMKQVIKCGLAFQCICTLFENVCLSQLSNLNFLVCFKNYVSYFCQHIHYATYFLEKIAKEEKFQKHLNFSQNHKNSLFPSGLCFFWKWGKFPRSYQYCNDFMQCIAMLETEICDSDLQLSEWIIFVQKKQFITMWSFKIAHFFLWRSFKSSVNSCYGLLFLYYTTYYTALFKM